MPLEETLNLLIDYTEQARQIPIPLRVLRAGRSGLAGVDGLVADLGGGSDPGAVRADPEALAEQINNVIIAVNGLIDRQHEIVAVQVPEAADTEPELAIEGEQAISQEIADFVDSEIDRRILGEADAAEPELAVSDTSKFWARITGAATDGTNRWAYAWLEIKQDTAGYGTLNWSTVDNGRSGTTGTDPARNLTENINGASGMLGIGITVANLTATEYTAVLQPIPTNAIVWLHEDILSDGETIVYNFKESNAVLPTCV